MTEPANGVPASRRGLRRMLPALIVGLLATVAFAGSASAVTTPAVPIPQDPFAGSVQPFLGSAQPARPFPFGPAAPRHPYMAPNGRSNIHDDAYQSDAYTGAGPLGRNPTVASTLFGSECASVTFDSRGRIVTVCVGAVRPTLRLIDPRTLATLASYDLPPRNPATLPSLFTSFGGGGYFYLDQRDRAVVPTNDGHIVVLREAGSAAAPTFALDRDYDVSSVVAGSSIESALPDWSGRLWFLTDSGSVGVVDPVTGRVTSTHLPAGETIANSLAVDETGGVFVVSTAALYRYDADSTGRPRQTWRADLRRGYAQEARTDAARLGDDADHRPAGERALRRHHRQRRPADARPGVPGRPEWHGRHADLLGAGVRARQGLDGQLPDRDRRRDRGREQLRLHRTGRPALGRAQPSAGAVPSPSRPTPTTEPGVTRIDVDYAHGGCHAAWTNGTVRVPTSVSKASAATGLVYVYSHPAAGEVRYRSPHVGDEDPWYLTALDLRSGRQVWSRFVGVGLGFNNNYAPISLGPDGTAYIGTLGGLAAVRDGG